MIRTRLLLPLLTAALVAVTAQSAAADGSWAETGGLAPAAADATAIAVDTATHDVQALIPGDFDIGADRLATFRGTAETATVDLPSRFYSDLAVDSSTHTAYLSDATAADLRGGAGLTVVAGATVTRVALDPTMSARAVAVDPSTHTAYVLQSSSVAVVRGGKVLATIPVDQPANDIAVDSASHAVYVATRTGVAVLSDTAVVRTVPLDGGTGAIAVDSATHEVYAAPPTDEDCTDDCGTTRVFVRVLDGTAVHTVAGDTSGEVRALAVDPVAHVAFGATTDGRLVVFGAQAVRQTLATSYSGFPTTRYLGPVAVDPGAATTYVGGSAGVRVIGRSALPAVERVGPSGSRERQGATLYVVFSQAMDKASVEASFVVANRTQRFAGTVSWAGDRVLLWRPAQPLPLTFDLEYVGWVLAGAKDATGRALPATRTWTFAASVPDPYIQAQSPKPRACVYPSTPLWAQWSEPVDVAGIAARTTLVDGAGRPIPGRASTLGGIVAGFTPDALLAVGTTATFTIPPSLGPAGAFAVQGTTSTFTVTTPPTIAAIGPPDGTTGVSTTAPAVYVVFNQPMNGFTLPYALTIRPEDTPYPPTPVTVRALGNQIIGLTPNAPLRPDTRYVVRMDAIAEDLRGCGLAGDTFWTFTTGPSGAAGGGLRLGRAPEAVEVTAKAAAAATGGTAR